MKYMQRSIWSFIFVSILEITSIMGALFPFDVTSDFEENVEITIATAPKRTKTKLVDPFPFEMAIQFPISGNPVTLKVHRTPNADVNIPLYVARDGNLELQSMPRSTEKALYIDSSTMASFLIHNSDLGNGQYEYEFLGTFTFDATDFVVMSVDEQYGGKNKKHKLIKQKRDNLVFADYLFTERDTSTVGKKFNFPLKPNRQKRAADDIEYVIKMFFATDYSVYEFWYNQSTAVSADDKDKEAKISLRQYYAFILNGIIVRYTSVYGRGFTLHPVVTGLCIADMRNESSWTESIVDRNYDRPQVDSSQALELFEGFVNSASNIPIHAHAMAFTAYDLVRNGGSNAGLAYLGQVCLPLGQSIVEDDFNFIILVVAAHELGHSLSASHDGDGNSCNGNDGFVMSSVATIKSGDEKLNPWSFSSCSIDYFETLINQLNSNGINCMITDIDLNGTTQLPVNSLLPGQLYPGDSYCKMREGNDSSICRGFYDNDFTGICTIMYCNKLDSNSCSGNVPGDGTVCGDKKWCISGVCTVSDDAPAGSDTCTYGDQPGIVISDTYTCVGLITDQPYQCYSEGIAEVCCSTCADFYTGIWGCEYGDTANNCDAGMCDRYSESDLPKCCLTCNFTLPTTTSATTTYQTTIAATVTTTNSHAATTIPIATTTNPVAATTTPKSTTTIPTSATTTPIATTTIPAAGSTNSVAATMNPTDSSTAQAQATASDSVAPTVQTTVGSGSSKTNYQYVKGICFWILVCNIWKLFQ